MRLSPWAQQVKFRWHANQTSWTSLSAQAGRVAVKHSRPGSDTHWDPYSAEVRQGAAAPCPAPQSSQVAPTSASLRMVRLDEVKHFGDHQKASVASLRRCSPSARNGVRLPSGMLFSLAGIPRQAAHFLTFRRQQNLAVHISSPRTKGRNLGLELNMGVQSTISLPAFRPGEIQRCATRRQWETLMDLFCLTTVREYRLTCQNLSCESDG